MDDQFDYNAVDRWVGARVAAARRARGWSQTDLGKQIDVTFQQVQKYEKGANRFSASRLYRVAEALDVDLASLFPPTADEAVAASAAPSSSRESERVALAMSSMSPDNRRLVVNLANALAGVGED